MSSTTSTNPSRRVQTRRTLEPGAQPDDSKWQILADTGPIPVDQSGGNNGTGTATNVSALIVPSLTQVHPGQPVTLDGSQSTGHELIYRWFQTHGTTVDISPTVTAPMITFVAPDNTNNGKSIEHTLMFQLHVKDSQGHDSITTTDIKVVPATSTDSPTQAATTEPSLKPSVAPPTQTTSTTKPLLTRFTADVANHSSKITAQELQKVCDAVKKQMDNDASPYWGYTAAFNFGDPVKGNAKLGIFDTSDEPRDLGWHTENEGEVTIECFYVSTYEDLCQTISHEMLETIGDYDASTTVKGHDEQGKECLYYLENCDPVEEQSYFVDGISVSNFVTPAWFMIPPQAGTPDARTDFMQVTAQPFDIANGGYMECSYDDGKSWTENRDRVKFDELSGSRKQKRAKRRAERKQKRTKKL